MYFEKYTTTTLTIGAVLGLIEGKQIAIPEMQRPFVWKKIQVRDYMDSLYRGYPTGNFTIWKNHDVRLKDGKMSEGKKIIIDGQQRITALMSAIVGSYITLSDYQKGRIKIAFNPFQAFSEDKDAEIFAVQDSTHLKSKRWIPDIAKLFKSDFSEFSFIMKNCEYNPDMNPETLNKVIQKLKGITNRTLGLTELSDKLDIDTVTEIFIRINSKGSELSQGDFAMSKIAADEKYGGTDLRKAIDYFAHLCRFPEFYDKIKRDDREFTRTDYFTKMEWLKNAKMDVYCPDYGDLIRVAFMHKCHRAKLSELVSLLSGRDFVSKEYKEEVIADTYTKMKDSMLNIISEYNFNQFMVAINSAGFISKKLINSQMALNFAYVLYLTLMESHEVSPGAEKHLVQRWYVLSVLTGRYTNSPESSFAKDIHLIHEHGVVATLKDIEAATLSETFWNVAVVQNLMHTSTNNPTYLVYLAAQVMMNDVSLLSNSISVQHLINGGDVHHIFPKEYLKECGHDKSSYNQVGNYAYLDSGINKSIGKKAPNVYFAEARKQCESESETKVGTITDFNKLLENLAANCIPEDIFDMDNNRYEEFLEKRRILMAKKIRKYYESL